MGEEKLRRGGETKRDKMIDERSKERSCDVIFPVAHRRIRLILRAIHSQKMFVCEVTVETVSDYMKKEIITTQPLLLMS